MNYQKIYDSLIQKRRLNKIDRSETNNNVEYHHIVPVSCGGINDERSSKYNNENYNIIGLTLNEHFFAHLLLQQIYKEKYGVDSPQYKCMLKAVQMMLDYEKYGKKSSKFYKALRLAAFESGSTITTTGRVWVTNGKQDIFLKPNEDIPEGFHKGRTLFFNENDRQNFHNKASKAHKGIKSWNSGKHGIYSAEYRKKISDNHADVSGKNNPCYGKFGKDHPKFGKKESAETRKRKSLALKRKSKNPEWIDKIRKSRIGRKMMNNTIDKQQFIKKEDIQKFLDDGWIFGYLK